MQDEHREAIQNNFASLVDITDLESIASALYEKGVFSEAMMEPYRDTNKDDRTRKRQLYRDIMRRGPDAFHHLLDALAEAGYWDLARDLDPNSPLHLRPRIIPINQKSGGNEFVSLSTENENQRKKKIFKENDFSEQPVNKDEDSRTSPRLPSPEISHFDVIKSTKFKEDNDEHFKLYRTRSRRRGILVVFSYVSFKNDIEEYRNGIDVDCNNLKHLFSEIGFRVLSYMNLSKEETRSTLEQKETFEGFECVFIMVSSHGYERARTSDTDIRCSDGNLISFFDIIQYFNNENSPGLRNVPKVFIFQLCRGVNNSHLVVPPQLSMPRAYGAGGRGGGGGAGGVRTDGAVRNALAAAQEHRDRAYSDILIGHSTLPGFVSHRDPTLGSWYVQALCEVFAAHAHDCHVEDLLKLVDKQLKDRFKVQTSSIDNWGFNHRLYLHPGLFED